MEKLTVVVSIIGVIGTISSVFFAYLACRRNLVKDEHTEAKNEGADSHSGNHPAPHSKSMCRSGRKEPKQG